MVVGDIEIGTDILIVGAGPAGYTLAIRCARLGMDVTLVNKNELGGVCLHRGCVPVKTLLYVYRLADDCRSASHMGLSVGDVSVDAKKANDWKASVVRRLESGIRELCLGSGVQILEGTCKFTSSSKATVLGPSGTQHAEFKRAVIATGSSHRPLSGLPFDGKLVIHPDEVMALDDSPEDIIMLGGGYGAITLASLLVARGKRLTIIHKGENVLSFLDADLIKPAIDKFKEKGVKIYSSPSWSVKRSDDKIMIDFEHDGKKDTVEASKLVPAIGLSANTEDIGLENTGIKAGKNGFIETDDNFKTADPAFYAIGDVRSDHCNATMAFREAMSLAEMLNGKPGLPDCIALPQSISTEPEIASAGFGEKDAKAAGIDVVIGIFPFAANGKAVTIGKTDGFVKVVAEKSSHRILGMHAVGPGAFDILQEGVLAIEMGSRLEDVALTLHPHPTLSEAIKEACATALGTSTNLKAHKDPGKT